MNREWPVYIEQFTKYYEIIVQIWNVETTGSGIVITCMDGRIPYTADDNDVRFLEDSHPILKCFGLIGR